MNVEADLHIHSTASDGELTPREIVLAARDIGIKAIAITDHDSVEAVENGLMEGGKAGIKVVAGVEISCVYAGEEVHILGYFIDTKNLKLADLLRVLQSSRHTRLLQMLDKAKRMGFALKLEDIEYDGVPGRAHFGRALVKKGYVRDMHEAFTHYLKLNGPLYVERYDISPREIIEIICNAGGVTSLAHPGLLKDKRLIAKIVSFGVQGLEVYYPLHSKKQVRELARLAEKHRLAPTGGSDFHGPKSNPIPLGAAGIPISFLAGLEERIKK